MMKVKLLSKKLVAGVLAVALTGSLATAMMTSAAGEAMTVKLVPPTTATAKGTVVNVPVKIDIAGAKAEALQFDVTFDKAVMEFKGMDLTGAAFVNKDIDTTTKAGSLVTYTAEAKANTDGKVVYGFVGTGAGGSVPVGTDKLVINLKFAAKSTATATTSKLTFARLVGIAAGATDQTQVAVVPTATVPAGYDFLIDQAAPPLPVTAAPTAVTITAVKAGVTVGEAITINSDVAGKAGTQSYEWSKDGKVLTGKTDANLTIAAATADDAGSYTLAVKNTETGKTESTATTSTPVAITVTAATAPSVTVSAGGPVGTVLTATPAGVPAGKTPTYVWFKTDATTGTAIDGATAATYTPTEAGEYFVEMTVDAVAYDSNVVAITPAVVPGVPSVSISAGGPVGTVLTATPAEIGTKTPTYAWFKTTAGVVDGTAITGATAATYTPTEAGKYFVKMTIDGVADPIPSNIVEITGGTTPAKGLLGDVDNDGTITAADAAVILKHDAEVTLITEANAIWRADVDGDKAISAADAAKVLKHDAEVELIVQPK